MRFLKRIIYGGVMVGIAIGAILLTGNAAKNANPTCSDGIKNQGEAKADCGGPCRPCGVANQIIISESGIFPHDQAGKTSFYAVFSNLSGDYWVSSFNYKLYIYDRYGTLIETISGASSLPPAAVTGKGLVPGVSRAVAVAANVAPIDAFKMDVEVADEDWKPVSAYADSRLSVGNVRFSEDGGKVTVSGTARNNTLSTAEDSLAGAIFRDKAGKAIGVSVSAVGDVPSLSAKDFEIFWRSEGGTLPDASKTEIFTERK
jgi:hypothetical protein